MKLYISYFKYLKYKKKYSGDFVIIFLYFILNNNRNSNK